MDLLVRNLPHGDKGQSTGGLRSYKLALLIRCCPWGSLPLLEPGLPRLRGGVRL